MNNNQFCNGMVRQTISGYKDAFWNTIKQYVPTALTTLGTLWPSNFTSRNAYEGIWSEMRSEINIHRCSRFSDIHNRVTKGKFWKQNSKWPLVKECFNLCGASLKWNYAAIKSNIVKDN